MRGIERGSENDNRIFVVVCKKKKKKLKVNVNKSIVMVVREEKGLLCKVGVDGRRLEPVYGVKVLWICVR